MMRVNEAAPDGRPSLTQKQIACWPHDTRLINLGKLRL